MKTTSLKFIRNVDLEEEEILCIESAINYSQLHLKSGKKITIAKTLKQVSEIVKDRPFVRINRQFLINVKHVIQYELSEFPQIVTLCKGIRIDFS